MATAELLCTCAVVTTTVYEVFTAVQKYSLTSRVCSDQGLENVQVGRHMIEKRVFQRRSMVASSSTHNQRIERLWKDLHKSNNPLL